MIAPRTLRSASAIAAFSDAIRGIAADAGSSASSSVARRPGSVPRRASVRASVPEVTTNGLPEPSSAAPIVSTARRSAAPAPTKSEKSCMNAR